MKKPIKKEDLKERIEYVKEKYKLMQLNTSLSMGNGAKEVRKNMILVLAPQDPELKSYIEKHLSGNGYYFIFSQNPNEAIEIYKVHIYNIKDVIIDLGLEKEYGFKLFDTIKHYKKMIRREPQVYLMLDKNAKNTDKEMESVRGIMRDVMIRRVI